MFIASLNVKTFVFLAYDSIILVSLNGMVLLKISFQKQRPYYQSSTASGVERVPDHAFKAARPLVPLLLMLLLQSTMLVTALLQYVAALAVHSTYYVCIMRRTIKLCRMKAKTIRDEHSCAVNFDRQQCLSEKYIVLTTQVQCLFVRFCKILN